MICWREDWLPDNRPFGTPDPERIIEEDGEPHAKSLDDLRRDLGLSRPYGAKAKSLKVGELKPVAKPKAKQAEDPSEPPEEEHELAPDEVDAPPASNNGGPGPDVADAADVDLEAAVDDAEDDDTPF